MAMTLLKTYCPMHLKIWCDGYELTGLSDNLDLVSFDEPLTKLSVEFLITRNHNPEVNKSYFIEITQSDIELKLFGRLVLKRKLYSPPCYVTYEFEKGE